MPDKRRFICVTCPVGCNIDATVEGERLFAAEGQACKRGLAFVQEELKAPKRVLTTTVRVRGGAFPLVPVRSAAPLPKGRLLEVAELLRGLVLEAPIQEHQVVARIPLGAAGSVEIVTTRALAW